MKFTALMAAAILGVSTLGSVSVMAAESTEAMAVPADQAGMVVDDDAVAAEGDAIPSDFIQGTFKPSETTVQAQDSYEYPFLGLTMKLPEELLKQIKEQTIAMITNEGWNDNADAIKYAYISWSEMTEEQKEAEVDKLGTAYDDWCKSLAKIGVIGLYDEDSEKELDELTGCTEHKEIGSSSDGKYKYYLSTNKDADESLKKEVEKIDVTLTEMTPFQQLSAFDQPQVPNMLPINILELAIRPTSLCMRLFGNVLGSFVVMKLLEFICPAILPLPFSLYFDFFDGFIQAYVFVFLTSLFIKEAIE